MRILRPVGMFFVLGVMAGIPLSAKQSAPSTTAWIGVVRATGGQTLSGAKVVVAAAAAGEHQRFRVTGSDGKFATEKSLLDVSILFGFGLIHRYRRVFPVPLAMACSWDPAVKQQAQHSAAEDASDAGIEWTITPLIDIARDARWHA